MSETAVKQQIQHTPTPWRYEASTKTIRSVPANYWLATMDSWDGAVDSQLNAEFIVRAVNAHEALVAALEYVPEQIDLSLPRYKNADDSDTVTIEVTVGWLRECRDALAAATR